VFDHVACLLLARVIGKSPAEYLTDEARSRVWLLGVDVLDQPVATIEELHARRDRLLT